MKDICILYNKKSKVLIKKVVHRLETDGISCVVAQRDYNDNKKEELENAVLNSNVLLLIVDSNSAKSKAQVNALEIALEADKNVIPFVVEKIESTLFSEFFFYSFSWIDAYEDSFDDAYDILIDAYEDKTGENTQQKKNKKVSKNKTVNKPIIIAAAVLVLALLSYFTVNYFKTSQKENLLVGKWNLIDYQDNMVRRGADSLQFFTQTLPNLKQVVLLIFNDDNTFERRGFTPEPQIGTWKLNAKESTLNLKPYGATASADELKLENLTENSFVIVAEEELNDSIMQPDSSYRYVTSNAVTRIMFAKQR